MVFIFTAYVVRLKTEIADLEEKNNIVLAGHSCADHNFFSLIKQRDIGKTCI